MCKRSVEFLRLQYFAIDCTKTEGNWIVWRDYRFGYAELDQFGGKPFAPGFAAAECAALAAQSPPPAQVIAVTIANQYANIFELCALAHGVANRASADIKAKYTSSEKVL